MRVVNRTAVSIVGAQPYVEWTLQNDADVNRGMLTIARTKLFGSVFLLPEFELEEDVQEWVEENWAWMFELQLDAWTSEQTAWPEPRDLKMFREWFRLDVHNIVVDVGDDDIEGEEL